MNDKLNTITLAILSYNKALLLKELLERECIKVYISNLHAFKSIVESSVVRIKIKESDLYKALKIVESSEWLADNIIHSQKVKNDSKTYILVPIDFSEYSLKTCELAFRMAEKSKNCCVTLFHAYLTSSYVSSLMQGDTFSILNDRKDDEHELKNIESEINILTKTIDEKVKNKELPNIEYNKIFSIGVPEEEILKYTKEHPCSLIIMGTRGESQKDVDLIGSVTAEVIERSNVNVLAIPECTQLTDFDSVKHIAFITNFEKYDLIALNTFLKGWYKYEFSLSLLYLTTNFSDKVDKIKFSNLNDYFHSRYPNIKVEYDVVKGDDLLLSLDEYIKNHKIDIITLTSHKRNVFARLFNPSIARKMIFHSDTPLLVIK